MRTTSGFFRKSIIIPLLGEAVRLHCHHGYDFGRRGAHGISDVQIQHFWKTLYPYIHHNEPYEPAVYRRLQLDHAVRACWLCYTVFLKASGSFFQVFMGSWALFLFLLSSCFHMFTYIHQGQWEALTQALRRRRKIWEATSFAGF